MYAVIINVLAPCQLFVGIIYDTRIAKIYIKICVTNFFCNFFEMGLDYREEIAYITRKIKELRLANKMTVQELAYRCDMERSNMSRIEAGRTNLTLKTLCTICNALNVTLRDVIR